MKKIFIYLPDGVGVRNFLFSNFNKILQSKNNSVTYWNNTVFEINKNFNFDEIKIENAKAHYISDLLRRARRIIEIKLFYKKFKDSSHLLYNHSLPFNTFKNSIKSFFIVILVNVYKSDRGVKKLMNYINRFERKTSLYKNSIETLKLEKPNYIFCTNQRPLLAIAPMLAAKDLGIKTSVFIFSWDNLPKAMMVVEADFYHVWSDYMKQELLKYYPYVRDSQVIVCGTPQFEVHFDESKVEKKEAFYSKYNLDHLKKYILFSGDDVTTSPYDHFYLEDLAKIIKEYNRNNDTKLGVIYRKCPVDFTERHLSIVNKYKDTIVCIDPLWENLGNSWDNVMPLKEDNSLLANTIRYSELVVNVGSSMVFDAVCHGKPCAYINYNVSKGDTTKWNIEKIYEFIHFKSMPSKDAVLWVNTKEDYSIVLDEVLKGDFKLEQTKKWFSKINNFPKDSSEEIYRTINSIILNNSKI